jgi:hypothetical protein
VQCPPHTTACINPETTLCCGYSSTMCLRAKRRQQGKKKKKSHVGKKGIKLSLYMNNIIVCLEIPKESITTIKRI